MEAHALRSVFTRIILRNKKNKKISEHGSARAEVGIQ